MNLANNILRDTFFLAVILIVVVYYVGSTNLLKTGLTQGNSLLLTATGRNQQGTFEPYPK